MSISTGLPTVLPQFDTHIRGRARMANLFRGFLAGLFRQFLAGLTHTRSDERIVFSATEEGYETLISATGGMSEIARFICEQTQSGREQLLRSISLGSARATIKRELQMVIEKCSTTDWDGYGAAPVTATTVSDASRFADVVPMGLMVPSVGVEPDGSITFEWYAAARKTLSVSIDEEGTLHYAALIGLSRSYGSEAFVGVLPKQILDLIYRVSVG
jgi:hypothetical protein